MLLPHLTGLGQDARFDVASNGVAVAATCVNGGPGYTGVMY